MEQKKTLEEVENTENQRSMMTTVMMMVIQKVTTTLKISKSEDHSLNKEADIFSEMMRMSQLTLARRVNHRVLNQLPHSQPVMELMAQLKSTAELPKHSQSARTTPNQSLDQDKAILLAELFQNAMVPMVPQKKTAGQTKLVLFRDMLDNH